MIYNFITLLNICNYDILVDEGIDNYLTHSFNYNI